MIEKNIDVVVFHNLVSLIKETRLLPKEANFVGEVPVVNRLEGSEEEGRVIGTARIERLDGGNLIAHVDASGMTGEILRRGFSIGSFSFLEDKNV